MTETRSPGNDGNISPYDHPDHFPVERIEFELKTLRQMTRRYGKIPKYMTIMDQLTASLKARES